MYGKIHRLSDLSITPTSNPESIFDLRALHEEGLSLDAGAGLLASGNYLNLTQAEISWASIKSFSVKPPASWVVKLTVTLL